MTDNEAAQAIAAVMETMETNANDGMDAVTNLDEAWTTISEIVGVSTLETLAFKTELETIVSTFRSGLYRLHSDMTKRAVSLGIEALLPQPRGGTR